MYPLYQVDRYRVGDRITDGVIPDRTMENAECIPAKTDCLDIYRRSFYRAGRGASYGHLAFLESGPGKSRKNYKNGLSCNIISFQSS